MELVDRLMAVLDQDRVKYLVFPGDKDGLLYLKMDDGHVFAMVGREGHTGKCVANQLFTLLKRKGRMGRKKKTRQLEESDEEDSEDSSKQAPTTPQEENISGCSCRPVQQHRGGHPPPGRKHFEEMMFGWACKLLAIRFPVLYSPTEIVTDVYRVWPLQPRLSMSNYTDLLKEKLAIVQKKVILNVDTSGEEFIRIFSSNVFRKLMDHLMTAPFYWGPPRLRGNFNGIYFK